MKRSVLTLSLVLVVMTSGCVGGLLGGDQAATDPAEQAPDSAEGVIHIDLAEFREDPETNQLLELFAAEDDEFDGPDDVESDIEDELDFDLDDVDELLVFIEDIESGESAGGDTVGAIAHGEFDTDEAIEAVEAEEGTLDEATYNDHTIYTFEDDSLRGGEGAIAALAEGQIAFGDRQSVEAAIDTAAGDRPALSGDRRDEYDRVTEAGLIGMVVDFPAEEVADENVGMGIDTSAFEAVEMMSVQYYTGDGTVGTEIRFHAESASDAQDIRDVVAGALVAFGDTGLPEADAEIEKISAEQAEDDETVVVITYESELDDIEALLDALP